MRRNYSIANMSARRASASIGAEVFRLDGRTAVVAGGLGKIGGAITRALAAAGARVVVVDKSTQGWPALARNVGSKVTFIAADLAKPKKVHAIIAGLDARLGGIHVWVNCAYPRTTDWGTRPGQDRPESWQRNVEMQMVASCLAADSAAQLMAKRGGGSIINVASTYGVVAPDFAIYRNTEMTCPAAYAAIKGGMIAHTRYLASYYGRSGVRVNALCPGGIVADQPKGFIAQYARRTVLGRMANADEIGPPAAFLASDAASYITGIVLMVDGGWTAI